MTLLEKAKEVMELRFLVIEAQSKLLICNIAYNKWKKCYDNYLKMSESEDLEVKTISQGLGKSLYDASVLCFDEEENKNYEECRTTILRDLNTSRKVLVSNR